MRIRFEFAKDKEARFISHLDLIRVFERSVRRAGLPLTYSQGFNPHPKIAFGPALALGTASDKEYVDISFNEDLSANRAVEALRSNLPPGLSILRGKTVSKGAESLNALINRARYTVSCPLKEATTEEKLRDFCKGLLEKETIMIRKQSKKGIRDKDIRKGIFHLECHLKKGEVVLLCELLLGPEGSVRPEEVVSQLVALGMSLNVDYQAIRRTGLYHCQEDFCADPIQVL